jgi:hypothetical protein
MEAVEKIHRAQAKEYERVLKVLPSSHSVAETVLTLTADHLEAS